MNRICLLYVTFDSETAAESMIEQLISERLIACGNKIPIKSIYLWEGAACKEDETVVLMKTSKGRLSKAKSRIEALHSYQVPCIIDWEVSCNPAYYRWVLESVAENKG